MPTYYRTLEISDADGNPSGKYRKVEHNGYMTTVHGLCDHKHDTVEEADACPDIQEEMNRVFPKGHTMERNGYHVVYVAAPNYQSGGQIAFAAYNEDRGGVNHLGNPTPAWGDLPEEIRHAWQAAAIAVAREIQG